MVISRWHARQDSTTLPSDVQVRIMWYVFTNNANSTMFWCFYALSIIIVIFRSHVSGSDLPRYVQTSTSLHVPNVQFFSPSSKALLWILQIHLSSGIITWTTLAERIFSWFRHLMDNLWKQRWRILHIWLDSPAPVQVLTLGSAKLLFYILLSF